VIVILTVLATTAVLLGGVNNLKEMLRYCLKHPSRASWLQIPFTDTNLDISTANKLANSAQVREKGLKILQYILRVGAYSEILPAATSKHLKDLSKITSIARRFFKFCRWIKHFEDFREAADQQHSVMRFLLYLRIAANFGADWMEDVCSLERIGLLPRGTLSVDFTLSAEYFQLALALVETAVTAVRVRKLHEVTELVDVADNTEKSHLIKQRRKLVMVWFESNLSLTLARPSTIASFPLPTRASSLVAPSSLR